MTQSPAEMRVALMAVGKRVTPDRELLIDIIGRNPHIDALGIHRLAQDSRPRIGLATVYRTLRLLEELAVVEADRLGEGHSHYEIRGRDHLHLVCANCGEVLDVPSPIDRKHIAREHAFVVTQSRLELVGLCAACRPDAADHSKSVA
jgi:Fur family ferric uptake transcriptional regulator